MVAYGPLKPALARSIDVCEDNPWLQQFGQTGDEAAWDGRTACTHVICQALALIWLGRRYSLNQINSIAGMPYRAKNARGQARGMNNTELQRFFDRTGIPYQVRGGLTYSDLLSLSNRGPVMKATRHGSIPEWYRFRYNGRLSDNIPNGYASPRGKAGRTQINTGSDSIRHATLMLGYRAILDSRGRVSRYIEYRKDPNHRSPARPERPPFDVITTAQGRKEYEDYHKYFRLPLYAAIPTRALR